MTRDYPTPERVPTGVAGLDTVLNGGFMKGGIYIISGPPGAGKTILANQICFQQVAQGGRAAYVTLLAESHARMLLNLSNLEFFDPSVVPQSLYYLSAFSTLEAEGLKGLLDLVRREVRGRGASVLIIDGVVAAEETAQTDREFKKFIHELQTQISLSSCTTFLLTSGRGNMARPERTMVDGLVELRDELYTTRRERSVEITKFRGDGFLRGPHAFRISSRGLTVLPRIEALLRYPTLQDTCPTERISTGVPALDEMMHGGIPAGTTSMVSGPSGAGKTALGLHYMSRCSAEERGVYVSFYESRERAFEKAESLGLQLSKLPPSALEFLWFPTTEQVLDEIGHTLLRAVGDGNVRRVFIDGFDGLRRAATDANRVQNFFTAIANEFRVRNISTLYTMETHRTLSPYLESPPTGVSTMLENWIALRFSAVEPRLQRVLSVVKVRDSGFDPSAREVLITDRGLQIGEPVRNPLPFMPPQYSEHGA
jgi:circadian clock protein KaiC